MESYEALLASITGGPGETRTILDPATGTVVGEAPVHSVDDLDRASMLPQLPNTGGQRSAMNAAAPCCSKRQTPSKAPRKALPSYYQGNRASH